MTTDGYRKLFETTAARLSTAGIAAHFSHGAPVTSAQIHRCEDECGVPMPSTLRQFYLDVGDGLTFHWTIDPSNASLPFCQLNVPSIAELKSAIAYLLMLNECLVDDDFHKAQEQTLARIHYQRQKVLYPFLKCNADVLCIETIGENQAVVFHDHEWSSYVHGDSGTLIARSLAEFWHGWSTVAFVEPKDFWWPGTQNAFGTEWSVERFGFCLANAEKSRTGTPARLD